MLGICVQQNSKDNFARKMDFDSWTVKYKVQEFLQTLNAFQKLTIHLCQIAQMPKNSKIDDFKKALQTFHNQYYHEFLYHNTHRTPKCRDFIKTLREFEQIKKPKKSEYVELFKTLRAFQQKKLPGGHYNKIQFMFTDKAVEKWFHDEVGNSAKDQKHTLYENGIWTGHTNCPANYKDKPDEHLLHIQLNEKHQKTLLKLKKHNIQMHKDLFAHMEEEDPYKSIEMDYLQRSHEHVHNLNEKYETLKHNYEQLYEQHHELKNMFTLNQQVNHRQFDEINSLRYALQTKNYEMAYKDNELYNLKNGFKRYRYA